MNLILPNDYKQRLGKHIKDEFKTVLKPTHPCEYQKINCFKGSECHFIGLPNDACTFHIKGKCKYDPCKYKHYNLYANVYKKAKEDFKREERKPYAMFRRHFKRFLPVLTGLFGLIFNSILRKAVDVMGKKVF